jgi:hypothetical protein
VARAPDPPLSAPPPRGAADPPPPPVEPPPPEGALGAELACGAAAGTLAPPPLPRVSPRSADCPWACACANAGAASSEAEATTATAVLAAKAIVVFMAEAPYR